MVDCTYFSRFRKSVATNIAICKRKPASFKSAPRPCDKRTSRTLDHYIVMEPWRQSFKGSGQARPGERVWVYMYVVGTYSALGIFEPQFPVVFKPMC